ncbi:uncharacterized protein LOC111614520 [Centruroides sculpturatus]|uniref:uncharacterized protein LOC111614520 n=2 Tax=Centruroides sculpturatus TaxID=218467 RepID=UPI000C6DC6F2|nr:uncharacterized protein LOC111614520 [Centruroides sculpturatus]
MLLIMVFWHSKRSVKFWSNIILLFLFINLIFGQEKQLPTAKETEFSLIKSLHMAIDCRDLRNWNHVTIGLSPTRLIQVYALIKKLNNEKNCQTNNWHDFRYFDINDPSTWEFCIAGYCREGKCQCITMIEGENCIIFNGKCWMVYCNLTDCDSKEEKALLCDCNSNFDASTMHTKLYWYDEGLESTFIEPPEDWEDTKFIHRIKLNNIGPLVERNYENLQLSASGKFSIIVLGENKFLNLIFTIIIIYQQLSITAV